MPSWFRHSTLPAVAVATAAACALAGCSSGSGAPKPATGSSASSSSPSPSSSSTVRVPGGVELTDQGARLPFGRPASVVFESTRHRGTVLQLTVRRVQQGSLSDFKGFILDDAYKRRASYYYATVAVRNIGTGTVGGVPVPLWGVNATNTLLPAVDFTTRFARCPSATLPARFPPGASLSTCLVYLSPNRGALTSVSYRPSQQYNPITWTGDIAKPSGTEKPPPRKKPAPKRSG